MTSPLPFHTSTVLAHLPPSVSSSLHSTRDWLYPRSCSPQHCPLRDITKSQRLPSDRYQGPTPASAAPRSHRRGAARRPPGAGHCGAGLARRGALWERLGTAPVGGGGERRGGEERRGSGARPGREWPQSWAGAGRLAPVRTPLTAEGARRRPSFNGRPLLSTATSFLKRPPASSPCPRRRLLLVLTTASSSPLCLAIGWSASGGTAGGASVPRRLLPAGLLAVPVSKRRWRRCLREEPAACGRHSLAARSAARRFLTSPEPGSGNR